MFSGPSKDFVIMISVNTDKVLKRNKPVVNRRHFQPPLPSFGCVGYTCAANGVGVVNSGTHNSLLLFLSYTPLLSGVVVTTLIGSVCRSGSLRFKYTDVL